ncbi:mCG1050968 [Mus musculus]|nr:mCG1050968 [Mus musculus]
MTPDLDFLLTPSPTSPDDERGYSDPVVFQDYGNCPPLRHHGMLSCIDTPGTSNYT